MHEFRKREENIKEFDRPQGMSPLLHEFLCARGIGSVKEARAFLRPSIDMLTDPFELDGVKEASERIKRAIENKKKIVIYGDYDVDGVSASSIMYLTLKRMGADAEVYLPSRHFEGYGLNLNAIDEIAQRADMLVSVDCGITSHDLVEHAKEKGLEVIITDHHTPPEVLPECTVIDPGLNGYHNPSLCGGGVAYKLSEALLGREKAFDYIDIAGLATLADVVSLTGENRVIVSLALKEINRKPRIGIQKLIEVAGLTDKVIGSGNMVFQIAPRLNASGRLGSAQRAKDLLITDDEKEAAMLALELNEENKKRKELEDKIFKNAEEQLAKFDFLKHRVIVVWGNDWNSGVIGLAASKLVEKYNYPTIAIAFNNGVGTGSCRSIEGVNIYEVLKSASDLLVKFGGHKQAAGLTIEKDKLSAFIDAIDSYIEKNVSPFVYVPVSYYDVEADFDDVDFELVKMLDAFEPTGMGNPSPKFWNRAKVAEYRKIGADGSHLSLMLDDGTAKMRCVAFGKGYMADDMPKSLDFIGNANINTFKGRQQVEMMIDALKPTEGEDELDIIPERENRLLARFLTELLYNNPHGYTNSRKIGQDELDALLEESPQGTLVICADVKKAKRFANKKADLFIGRYPDDSRCFDSVCVMPEGKLEINYRNIVYAGMNAPDGCLTLDTQKAEWVEILPDVDELRRVYKAIRMILKRPTILGSVYNLARSVVDENGMDMRTAIAGIIVLIDAKLLALDKNGNVQYCKAEKTDIENTRAYKICAAL